MCLKNPFKWFFFKTWDFKTPVFYKIQFDTISQKMNQIYQKKVSTFLFN